MAILAKTQKRYEGKPERGGGLQQSPLLRERVINVRLVMQPRLKWIAVLNAIAICYIVTVLTFKQNKLSPMMVI